MAGPVDRRLLALAPVRGLLIGVGALTVLHLVAVVAQAVALAAILSAGLQPTATDVGHWITVLIGALVLRAVVAHVGEVVAGRAAGSVAADLRRRLLTAIAERTRRERSTADLPALQPVVTSGLDGVELYLGRYLPALVQATLIPAVMVAVLLLTDPLSAVIVLLTLPLVPLFMALIGMYTASRTAESLEAAQRLSGRFADVMAGLPDLVVFSRIRAQAAAVSAAAEEHRLATSRTLRIAFLSSMVLELISTLSVALVAVTSGLRLVGGSLDLRTALVVLLLAPEAFLPLRAVGAAFHTAVEGAVAVTTTLDLVEGGGASGERPGCAAGPRQDRSTGEPPDVEVSRAVVRYAAATVGPVDLRLASGSVTVLTGASGSGKSTVLALIAGLDRPDEGSVKVGGVDPSERLTPVGTGPATSPLPGWCGQDVALRRTSLREALTGGVAVDPDRFRTVLRACRFDEVLDQLPDGLRTVVGPGARDLSTGQRRRLGLVRALLADTRLVLLDEPTAGLDDATEAEVVRGLRTLLQGRTAVLTTHRSAVLELADLVVDLDAVSV